MRIQEVGCFRRALGCEEHQIETFDLLGDTPSRAMLDSVDVVLLGGSGHYGAIDDYPWLEWTLDCLREIHASSKPTFASCWGFQAMSRAMGGAVAKDLSRAELGTHQVCLTAAGRNDPLFRFLGSKFDAQMGHEDCVIQTPPDAVPLAFSELVENQAFCFKDKPIYCTQFHPELNRTNLIERIVTYPEYVERISGLSFERFSKTCYDTPQTETLLIRFVRLVFS